MEYVPRPDVRAPLLNVQNPSKETKQLRGRAPSIMTYFITRAQCNNQNARLCILKSKAQI